MGEQPRAAGAAVSRSKQKCLLSKLGVSMLSFDLMQEKLESEQKGLTLDPQVLPKS